MTLINFFFNDTATTEIYTLSLHDALPISELRSRGDRHGDGQRDLRTSRRKADGSDCHRCPLRQVRGRDRKSTRLNSSHANFVCSLFCVKKKIEETLSARNSNRLNSVPVNM